MKVFVFVFLLVCILKLGSLLMIHKPSGPAESETFFFSFFLFFSLSVFWSWGRCLWFTNPQSRRNRRRFPGRGFMNQLVSCSPSQSTMMAYMPVPCALGIISDYQPSKPENQKVQGSSLNGWPLPDSLLGNKTAVNGMSGQTCDVDQVSDVWMKNRSLYAKYPKGTTWLQPSISGLHGHVCLHTQLLWTNILLPPAI